MKTAILLSLVLASSAHAATVTTDDLRRGGVVVKSYEIEFIPPVTEVCPDGSIPQWHWYDVDPSDGVFDQLPCMGPRYDPCIEGDGERVFMESIRRRGPYRCLTGCEGATVISPRPRHCSPRR